MHDSELKKILLETCPVRPGQEARAWSMLRDRLYNNASQAGMRWAWLYYHLTWRRLAVASWALVLIPVIGTYIMSESRPVATADSQAPGVFATAFYSRSAQAQVVWLNGMEPATDGPTYLDPTTVIASKSETPQTFGDPNSL